MIKATPVVDRKVNEGEINLFSLMTTLLNKKITNNRLSNKKPPNPNSLAKIKRTNHRSKNSSSLIIHIYIQRLQIERIIFTRSQVPFTNWHRIARHMILIPLYG